MSDVRLLFTSFFILHKIVQILKNNVRYQKMVKKNLLITSVYLQAS